MKRSYMWQNMKINGLVALVLCSVSIHSIRSQNINEAWVQADRIINSIQKPVFNNKQYIITNYGAEAGGIKICTESINQAIRECSDNGGGSVIIPDSIYLTGPIHLKSNVNLHLEKGAILKFSTVSTNYLPLLLTRWEGVDCYNYSPLIYAYQQKTMAITGEGILDGQSDNKHWWPWKGKPAFGWKAGMKNQSNPEGRVRLMEYNNNETPVEQRKFGEDHYLRPPFIQFYQCQNILIEDVTIINSPFWIIHPLLCENITIRGILVNSIGPNNDGCDPESSKNILIENCRFNMGDDCIAIKSGRNNDGRKWNIPSENIVIRNCEMKEGHGGVVIGSEISGGCRNVFVYDCKMNSPHLDRAIRIKTNAERGVTIENLYVKNIEIGEVKEAVLKINCIYETKSEKGDYPPLVRNVYLENITSQRSKYPIYLIGLKSVESIKDIFLTNVTFIGAKKDCRISGVTNLVLENVYINGERYEAK